MIKRHVDGEYTEQNICTLGIDFAQQKYKISLLGFRSNEMDMRIWDTAGSERFQSLTKSFYKKAHGVVLCFSVTC